jgi:hypothetical protein
LTIVEPVTVPLYALTPRRATPAHTARMVSV